MTFKHSLTLFCLFGALALNAAAADWHEYKSENFTVYSDVPEPRVTAMMRDLERFRRAALTFTGLADRPENSRLRVYHFNSSREFHGFMDDGKIAGFYRETWDGPVIFSREGVRGISGSGLMFHEYVHHLMRERSDLVYPRWYSEGFAELLASADLRKDVVVIGDVPHWRLGAWLEPGDQPLDMRELLKPDYERNSARYWNNYYASAWLLTHYVQLGRHAGNPDYRGASKHYLHAVAEGADPQAVFEEHFGKSTGEMQREMRRYMRDDIYGHRFDIPEYDYSIPRRQLGENERLYLLAQKAQDLGRENLALEYLEKSERYAPGWRENRVAMAVLKDRQGDPEPGDKLLEEIEGWGLPGYRTATQLARLYLGRLRKHLAAGDGDKALYEQAVKFGRLAVEQEPQHLPGYRHLWSAYQHKGEKQKALQVMTAAYEQQPNHLALNGAIGFYLAHIGKPADARQYLERVLAWSHSAEARARAKEILEQGVE